jgi:hypothetical protein
MVRQQHIGFAFIEVSGSSNADPFMDAQAPAWERVSPLAC